MGYNVFDYSDLYKIRTVQIKKIELISVLRENTVYFKLTWPEPKHNPRCTCILGIITSKRFHISKLPDALFYIENIRTHSESEKLSS